MFGFKKKEEMPDPILQIRPIIPQNSHEMESMKRRVIGDRPDPLDVSGLIPESQESRSDRVEEVVPYAPVFVKLEKYGELLSDIARAEAIIERLKQLIGAMDKIEVIRANVYEGIKQGVREADEHLQQLDGRFRKPEIPRAEVHKPKFSGVPIEQVHKELEELKRELQSARR